MNAKGTVTEVTNPLLQSAISTCGKGFAVVAVFSMFINLLMLTAPLYMLQVFDRVITSQSTDTLVLLTLIAVFALLTMAALEAIRSFSLIRISSWLDRELSGHVLIGAISSTVRSGADPSIQGLRDVGTVRTFLSGPSLFPIMDAPWTPIFLGVMFLLHPLMGWLSVAGAVILFSFALANELATRKLLLLSGGASMAALNQAESSVRNADVIEAMGMGASLVRRWNSKNAESLELQARASARSGGITAASKFLRMCLQIGIMGLGAWLVIQGELTVGAMIAGSILMGRALAPVEQAIGTWKQLIAARNAYNRLKKQLNEAPPPQPAMPLPVPTGLLSVEGVAFTYPSASEPILRNITFNLQPGEALGLIGPTAVGKTTLARLLIGNFQPLAGHVRLDGMNVAQWDVNDLGRHIGYLPQDVELFSGTINENIARMGEVDAEAVVEAAKLAGVHEMVLHMEKGYDTEIGDGGAALSGGQRQRIALARAVYGDPKFLVLDEPSANLDKDGTVALINAMQALKLRGATVVVIAHRPTTLQNVDKILVLRKGMVEVFGPRDEVIAKLKGQETAISVANDASPTPQVVDVGPSKKPPQSSQDFEKPQEKPQKASPKRQPAKSTENQSRASSRPSMASNSAGGPGGGKRMTARDRRRIAKEERLAALENQNSVGPATPKPSAENLSLTSKAKGSINKTTKKQQGKKTRKKKQNKSTAKAKPLKSTSAKKAGGVGKKTAAKKLKKSTSEKNRTTHT